MKTVQIPGGTVALRDREDLRVRDRHMLERELVAVLPLLRSLPKTPDGELDQDAALAQDKLTPDVIDALYTYASAALRARLISWTLAEPALPTTVEEIENLPGPLYDALSAAVMDGIQDIMGEPNFEPVSPDTPGFSETPTGPLGG